MYLLFFKIVKDYNNLRYNEAKVNKLVQIDKTIEHFCTAITVKLENVTES